MAEGLVVAGWARVAKVRAVAALAEAG